MRTFLSFFHLRCIVLFILSSCLLACPPKNGGPSMDPSQATPSQKPTYHDGKPPGIPQYATTRSFI